MTSRALAVVVAALFAHACSSKHGPQRPLLDTAMRERLKAIASTCEERSGQPKVDHVLECVSEPGVATVGVFLLEDNRVVQLWIELTEPTVDAAATKLGPALAGFVDDRTRDTILATVRATGPDPGYARAPALGQGRDAVVYVQAREVGGFHVTLQLMFDIPL